MNAEASNEYVLFVDLWGTTAKILNTEDTATYFSKADAPACQTHFRAGLLRLAEASPSVLTVQAGDWAFASSKNLSDLLHFTLALFKHMTSYKGEFVLWPLRGGITQGALQRAEHSPLANLQLAPVIGTGITQAAFLEKSAQRGMRLLVAKSIGETLSASDYAKTFFAREANTKGMEHFELNWMTPDSFTPGYLDSDLQGRQMRAWLQERARALIEGNDNFYQQVGSSLNDLLRWSAKL